MKTILKGRYLLDTNILVYAYNQASPFHKRARELILEAVEGKFEAFLAQQNLVEFCNVLSNKFHISKASIKKDLLDITSDITIINPLPQTLIIFIDLFENSKLISQTFDLYLAATMLDNDIHNIITLNNRDFEGIENISALNPF